jgi:hypothetical protein
MLNACSSVAFKILFSSPSKAPSPPCRYLSVLLKDDNAWVPATSLPVGKNSIRVRVWGNHPSPPMGWLMGENLTHQVKWVRVHSLVPHTRYLVGHPFKYDR